MKRIILIMLLAVFFAKSSYSQTTHTININGFSFSPNNLTIEIGDQVSFNGSSDHPVLEVSQETWDANDDTPLSGGFSFPSGIGEITFSTEGVHYYICENHIGSGMKGKISVVQTITDINIRGKEIFKIYPNPLTTNYLTVELPDNTLKFSIAIYDLTGSMKLSSELTKNENRAIINASDLSPGAYIIQLISDSYTHTSRFIKN
ncbi:MAG: hypothetical protein C0597_14020 [Marinilabiliales bacterium]|nr:MAG: hypothetical protein C0597_14020 [Marinilabiliales bacterium]